MKDLESILKIHAANYPLMAPCDAVKLVYQNEFGCGHFIQNEYESKRKLIDERLAADTDQDMPADEDIGNGYVRLNLRSGIVSRLPSEMISRMFIASSKPVGRQFGGP